MDLELSIKTEKDFILKDFRSGNYISLINRELEFYFNHHTKIKDSLNLSRMEGIYLNILKDNPSITQTEISRILKADAALVSKFTKNLLDKGYIYREEDTKDKRKRFLHLTEKAKDNLPDFTKAYEDFNKLALKEFTQEEYENFITLLDKFFTNIQELKKNSYSDITK